MGIKGLPIKNMPSSVVSSTEFYQIFRELMPIPSNYYTKYKLKESLLALLLLRHYYPDT